MPRKPTARIGHTYHGVEIVSLAPPHGRGGTRFTCRCSCGKLFDWRGNEIVRGIKQHCGCKSPLISKRDQLPVERSTRITYDQLRAEGVLEIGRIQAILFVRTERGVHLMHVQAVADRVLDDYAISLAVGWLEAGHPSYEVAANLDVDHNHLTRELARAGYARVSLMDGRERVGADKRIADSKRQRAGNRKGRLRRTGKHQFSFTGTHA